MRRVPDVLGIPGDPGEEITPALSEIPRRFKIHNNTAGQQFFGDLFFGGVRDVSLQPRPGVDKELALRALLAVARTYATAHERKEAGFAMLLHEWFSAVAWTDDHGVRHSRPLDLPEDGQ